MCFLVRFQLNAQREFLQLRHGPVLGLAAIGIATVVLPGGQPGHVEVCLAYLFVVVVVFIVGVLVVFVIVIAVDPTSV